MLLRRTLNQRIGRTGLPFAYLAKLWASALLAGAAAYAVRQRFTHHSPVVAAVVILGIYGVLYFGTAMVLGVAEVKAVLKRIAARF